MSSTAPSIKPYKIAARVPQRIKGLPFLLVGISDY